MRMKILLLIVILSFFTLSRGENEEVMSKSLPAYAFTKYAEILNGTSCQDDLIVFREAINNRRLWSLKLLDSSGEPKPGFVYGNNYWLGVRSQCYDTANRFPLMLNDKIKANNSKFRHMEDEFPPFNVHYFVAHFRHNSTLQYHVRLPNEDLITLGLCLPETCTTNDIGSILKRIFQDKILLISELYGADFKLVEVRDLTENKLTLGLGRIFVLIILSLLSVIMLIGTIYDIFVCQKYKKIKTTQLQLESININNNNEIKQPELSLESANVLKYEQSTLGKIVLCFSMYTNTKIIFGTKLSSDSIPEIHGLRFLGMIWIIMIHSIFYMGDYADNKPWSWRLSEGFAVQVIGNSTLSVDTYFFLSGFLIGYLFLKEQKRDLRKGKSINYKKKIEEFIGAVAKRFLRLTPVYGLMIGIVELNYAWYGETSQFYMSERPHEVCGKYWWRNILYINNLFDRETMCMSWSWYLSNDMQFFIVGTFLLILSSIYFYTAWILLISLLIGSIGITVYLSYSHGYVPTLDAQYHILDVLYDPPWTRIGPYIVGIVTSYILLKLNNRIPLKLKTIALLWILGSSCNLIVLFGIYQRYISVLPAAFYVGFSRTVWAVGLGWLLVACCTHHGGAIAKVLRLKIWIPMSRLTYCAYLLNPFLINSIYLHSEYPVHVDFLPVGVVFMGVFITTYICSYALCLMLETPSVLLIRLLVTPKQKR